VTQILTPSPLRSNWRIDRIVRSSLAREGAGDSWTADCNQIIFRISFCCAPPCPSPLDYVCLALPPLAIYTEKVQSQLPPEGRERRKDQTLYRREDFFVLRLAKAPPSGKRRNCNKSMSCSAFLYSASPRDLLREGASSVSPAWRD
jgi:hypothetical protein